MKKNLTLLLFGFLPFFAFSQIQHAFNYQAAVRNADGDIQFNNFADFKIEILQNDSIIYSENHLNKWTGKTGVVNFKVGGGDIITGNISQIDWSQGQLQIKVTLNGEPMGTADIVAVPIAIYAQNSGDGYWEKLDNDLNYFFGGAKTNNLVLGNGSNWPSLTMNTESGKTMYWEMPSSGDLYLYDPDNSSYRMYYSDEGNLGIGTSTPVSTLDVNGHMQSGNQVIKDIFPSMTFQSNDGNSKYFEMTPSGKLYLFNPSTNSFSFSSDESGRIGINTANPGTTLDVNGQTRTHCLEIIGGCDIKEDLNSVESLEPGDIVIIDESHPGNICRTNKKYDRKVLGVISGANGINPGISLSQEDILDGDYPLTMVGRVYVKVTGEITIGDMLTTSSVPGYAMAVKDISRAYGTVIGKAMTANKGGKGFVLVYVNLQ